MSDRRGGRPLVWVLGSLLLAGLVVFLARPKGAAELEPGDGGPGGLRGMVLLLEGFGARVEMVGPEELGPPGGFSAADVLFVPTAASGTRSDVATWEGVARGGARVVLGGVAPGFGAVAGDDSGEHMDWISECSGPIDLDRPVSVGNSVPLEDPREGLGWTCLDSESGPFVVGRPVGEGEVVNLASARILANASIGRPLVGGAARTGEDLGGNGELGVRLLLPSRGGRLVIVRPFPPPPASQTPGERSPFDLLSPGVRAGLWQVLVAASVAVLWGARRRGRAVSEALPVEIEGSELVDAVGRLLEKAGRPERAHELIVEQATRELARGLGIGGEAAPGGLIPGVALSSGRSEAEVAQILSGPPARSAADLLAAARSVDDLLAAALHRRNPPGPGAGSDSLWDAVGRAGNTHPKPDPRPARVRKEGET